MNTLKQELQYRIKRNEELIIILQKENERDKIMLQEIGEIKLKGGKTK